MVFNPINVYVKLFSQKSWTRHHTLKRKDNVYISEKIHSPHISDMAARVTMVAEFIGSYRRGRNVRIVCQDGALVSAHSAVLALNSSLLRELLVGELARGAGEELRIEEEMEEGFVLLLPQFSSGLVSAALTFLYTGQVQQFEVCLSQILGKDDFIDQLEGAGSITVTVLKEGVEGGSWPSFEIETSSEKGKATHVERNGELARADGITKTKCVNGIKLDQLKTTGQEKPKLEELFKNNKEEYKLCSTANIKPDYYSKKPESEASLHISKCLDSFEKYQSKFNKDPNLFEMLDSVAGDPIKEEKKIFQDSDLQEANESNDDDCTDDNQKLEIKIIKKEQNINTKISFSQNADNKCSETRSKEKLYLIKSETFLYRDSLSTIQSTEKSKRNLEKNKEHKLEAGQENKETCSEKVLFNEKIEGNIENTNDAFRPLETLKQDNKGNIDTDEKYFITKINLQNLEQKGESESIKTEEIYNFRQREQSITNKVHKGSSVQMELFGRPN